MLLDVPAKLCRFLAATFDESRIAMQLRNVDELHEHVVEEKPPSKPARRKPLAMYVQSLINRHNKPVR